METPTNGNVDLTLLLPPLTLRCQGGVHPYPAATVHLTLLEFSPTVYVCTKRQTHELVHSSAASFILQVIKTQEIC